MPREKFKLLTVSTGRGNKYVTFVLAKTLTEKGDGNTEQDVALMMGIKDSSGTWSFSQLIHKDGAYEWYDMTMFSHHDMEDWCEVQ